MIMIGYEIQSRSISSLHTFIHTHETPPGSPVFKDRIREASSAQEYTEMPMPCIYCFDHDESVESVRPPSVSGGP